MRHRERRAGRARVRSRGNTNSWARQSLDEGGLSRLVQALRPGVVNVSHLHTHSKKKKKKRWAHGRHEIQSKVFLLLIYRKPIVLNTSSPRARRGICAAASSNCRLRDFPSNVFARPRCRAARCSRGGSCREFQKHSQCGNSRKSTDLDFKRGNLPGFPMFLLSSFACARMMRWWWRHKNREWPHAISPTVLWIVLHHIIFILLTEKRQYDVLI